jgi:hypothetical protein
MRTVEDAAIAEQTHGDARTLRLIKLRTQFAQ